MESEIMVSIGLIIALSGFGVYLFRKPIARILLETVRVEYDELRRGRNSASNPKGGTHPDCARLRQDCQMDLKKSIDNLGKKCDSVQAEVLDLSGLMTDYLESNGFDVHKRKSTAK